VDIIFRILEVFYGLVNKKQVLIPDVGGEPRELRFIIYRAVVDVVRHVLPVELVKNGFAAQQTLRLPDAFLLGIVKQR